MSVLSRRREPALKPNTVDDDVAQFLQRMKDTDKRCGELKAQLEQAHLDLEESNRRAAFLEDQLKKASLDRDIYLCQYTQLHTELAGLSSDAEHFRRTVITALQRADTAVMERGTQQRAIESKPQNLDESHVKKLGETLNQ